MYDAHWLGEGKEVAGPVYGMKGPPGLLPVGTPGLGMLGMVSTVTSGDDEALVGRLMTCPVSIRSGLTVGFAASRSERVIEYV